MANWVDAKTKKQARKIVKQHNDNPKNTQKLDARTLQDSGIVTPKGKIKFMVRRRR